MRTRLFVLLAFLVAASLVAGPALGHRSAATSPCASGNVAKTASYLLALEIGPRQEMYMPSEVQSRKIKTGQVMLGGDMAMIDHVPAGMKVYDLAVHICTKSGAVVTTLKPTIVVKPAGGKPATHVAVAMMAGIKEGLRDYHYGNDVALTPEGKVTVTVTVKGQRAIFHATVPKQGSSGDSGMSMG
jgi:hypothetical protein